MTSIYKTDQPTSPFNLSTPFSHDLFNSHFVIRASTLIRISSFGFRHLPYRSMTLKRLLLYLWSSPTSLLGLAFLHPTLLTGGQARVVNDVLEVYGGLTSFFLKHCTLLPGG